MGRAQLMGAIRGTIRNGEVELDEPTDLPDGTRVTVAPVELMTEDEQGDDPESTARWIAWVDSLPVPTSSPFDDPSAVAWREAMRRQNIEAVRRQMEGERS